jgi:hypothetical protein
MFATRKYGIYDAQTICLQLTKATFSDIEKYVFAYLSEIKELVQYN